MEPAQTKSTGVLQDEELFSHSHEKDNDLDAGLFATSGRAEVSVVVTFVSFVLVCVTH